MIRIISKHNLEREKQLLEDCFRLRHEIFIKELGWQNVCGFDDCEIDHFDTDDAVHLASVIDSNVVGYSRLLPTTRPHLLSEVFTHLATRKSIPSGLGIFEWTRYCVSQNHRGGRAISKTASELICGVLEYCENNYIHSLTAVFEAVWITRFLEIGFEVIPLGLPQQIDGNMVVAVQMNIGEQTLNLTRRIRNIESATLSQDILHHV